MSHVAAWSEYTANVLDEIATGTWDGRDAFAEPGSVDRLNREWFERFRDSDLEDVRSAWRDSRARLLGSFGAMPEITPESEEWFEETGAAHYAEHLPDLVAWVERLRSDP